MWQKFKDFVKTLLPDSLLKKVRPLGHGLAAVFANWIFGRPSDKLVLIGVTGTNGKSTTVNLIAKILQEAGHKVGYFSTVSYDLGTGEKLNTFKMTTLSGWLMHKRLRQMLQNGVQYAVLEISSEALAQNRHLGINFDVAFFNNLTPEHLESHGGFENYKKAKAKLFKTINNLPLTIDKLKINPNLQKTIVSNIDDGFGSYYLNFKASRHVTYGIKTPDATFFAHDTSVALEGVSFTVQDTEVKLQLKGKFDIYNALAAIATVSTQNIILTACKTALGKISVIPGRMEIIQKTPFTVIVDYAPEPYSLQACYDTLKEWPHNRLIHILGSTGGGRDKARRKILGEMAGRTADIVIVTNEDPYDDNPQSIIDDVARGTLATGKILDNNLFKILDRREAVRRVLQMAQPNDLVLITGKGSEQKMALAHGQYINWDDRTVAREELQQLH